MPNKQTNDSFKFKWRCFASVFPSKSFVRSSANGLTQLSGITFNMRLLRRQIDLSTISKRLIYGPFVSSCPSRLHPSVLLSTLEKRCMSDVKGEYSRKSQPSRRFACTVHVLLATFYMQLQLATDFACKHAPHATNTNFNFPAPSSRSASNVPEQRTVLGRTSELNFLPIARKFIHPFIFAFSICMQPQRHRSVIFLMNSRFRCCAKLKCLPFFY